MARGHELVSETDADLKPFLPPCGCGTFAVPANYDHQGTAWSRYLKCPKYGKLTIPRTAFCSSAFNTTGTGRSMVVSKLSS